MNYGSTDFNNLSNSNSGLMLNNSSDDNIFSIDETTTTTTTTITSIYDDDGRGENDIDDIGVGGIISNFKFKDINDNDDGDEEDLIFSSGKKVNNNNGSGGEIIIEDPPNGFKGFLFYINLISYWFATSAIMGGLISMVWPSQIRELGGEANKAKYVGLLPILGALTSITISPLSGYLSDNCNFRYGKRRIFIAIGTVIALISLFITGSSSNIYEFMVFVMGIQFGINFGTSPFSGLMPDIVPKSKYGIASGYLAFANALGQLVGVVGTALCIYLTKSFIITYTFFVVILIIGSLPTLLFIKEKPLVNSGGVSVKGFLQSFYLPSRIYKNFYWVIITRLFQEMGIYSILPFFSYYLTDIIHVPKQDSEIYTSIVLSFIIIASVPSAIIGAPLSDKYGRKLLVYISCSIMTACTLGFIVLSFKPSLVLVIIFSGIFGIGYGCYQGVDYALALDVLPPDNVAKDLALWHQALIVPQVIAPAISGLIINSLENSPIVGYTIAFTIAVLWFLLSTIMIKPIKLNDDDHHHHHHHHHNGKNFIKLTPTSIDL